MEDKYKKALTKVYAEDQGFLRTFYYFGQQDSAHNLKYITNQENRHFIGSVNSAGHNRHHIQITELTSEYYIVKS